LKEAGAFYAALSGSGSSYFGLFTGDALKNRAEWPQSLFVGKLELTPKKKA
jgi:4-diphosphocytidyl-2C-methyl-D-erythritol kinase